MLENYELHRRDVFLLPPERVFANSPETACVLGLNRKLISFSPVTNLKAETDFE